MNNLKPPKFKDGLVSIVIPSYNHAGFIKTAIESIFNQSYKKFELLVVDDGSTDNSLKILKKLKHKYDFKLVSKENSGIASSFNLALKKYLTGEFFTFCPSDDFWSPEKLSKQVNFLNKYKNIGMVYSKAYAVDNKNIVLKHKTNQINKGLKGGNIFKNIFLQEFHPPVNYMFRRTIFERIGFYDEGLWAEDFDMNLRISYEYKVGFIDEYLSYYRVDIGANKNLTFKTIFSHKDSIDKFSFHDYHKAALKKWYYKCFLWYSPYSKGKKIALIGMLKNIDKFFSKEFIIFLLVLIRKWK